MLTTRADALKLVCPECQAGVSFHCTGTKKGAVHWPRYKMAQDVVNAAHPKVDYAFTGLVTIITDASFCMKTGAAGWAGRAISDGQRNTYSGSIKTRCTNINEVEIAAIANTIHNAIKDGTITKDKAILCQVDNLRALTLLRLAMRQVTENNRAGNITPMERRAIDLIIDMVEKYEVGRVTVRHVKAHKQEKDREARHHVHEAMDRLAKQGMRQARETIKQRADYESVSVSA